MFFSGKHSGEEKVIQVTTKEILIDAQESQKNINAISNLSDSDLNNIVFFPAKKD